MRKLPLLLCLALLLPVRVARAQTLDISSGAFAQAKSPSWSSAAPLLRGLDSAAPPEEPRPERDRVAGAGYGAVVGALVGGIGFATVNYTLTSSRPRDEYTLPSFLLGAAVGGTAGLIVGALVGAPERAAGSGSRAQVHLVPRVAHRATGGVSLSVRTSW